MNDAAYRAALYRRATLSQPVDRLTHILPMPYKHNAPQ